MQKYIYLNKVLYSSSSSLNDMLIIQHILYVISSLLKDQKTVIKIRLMFKNSGLMSDQKV